MPAPQTEEEQAGIVAFLSDPGTFGGQRPETVETHAARVFLVGDDAYKLKRAIRFPFLDFTTAEERQRVCRREIELNRRTAPDLYLDCLPITRDEGGALAIDGTGEPVDWVVHMRRFDAKATLDHLLETGEIGEAVADALAQEVAAMHETSERVDAGDPAGRVARVAEANLDALAAEPGIFDGETVRTLTDRTRAALRLHGPLIERRAEAGQVRRCHGDLHLGNVALIDGKPVIFDALEFDEELATTDLLYDLAFLLMDCWRRGARHAANRILNRWISRRRQAGDLDGLALLPLFLSMRAAVRAKVAAARAAGRSGSAAEQARQEARAYLDAAAAMLTPATPALVAVGGFSGSGKSSVARGFAAEIPPPPGAVILRSDQIRKEMAGCGEYERLPESAYTRQSSDEVYAEIRARAARVLRAGHSVVADAVHGTDDERTGIAAVARSEGAVFAAIWLEADRDTLAARVSDRRDDASDATASVVNAQMAKLAAPEDWPHVRNSGSLADAIEKARRELDKKFRTR